MSRSLDVPSEVATLRDGGPATERVVAGYALAAMTIVLLGLLFAVWRPTAPAVSTVGSAADLFPDDYLAATNARFDPRYVARLVGDVLTLVVLIGMAMLPATRRALRGLAGPAAHRPRRAAIVAAVMLAAAQLAVLPVSAVMDFAWTGAGSEDGVATWVSDWVIASVPLWGLVGVGAALVTVAARRWPRSWHWRLGIAATGVVALVGAVGPWVIDPLTVDTRELRSGDVRDAVEEVVGAARLPNASVVVGRGASVATRGAYVSGIGASRRVVLASSLERFPPEQVAFVVAHELAHSAHNDVPRTVILTSAWVVIGLAVTSRVMRSDRVSQWTRARSATDPRRMTALVVVVMLFGGLVVPLESWASRRSEAAADAVALRLVDDPGAAERLFRYLAVEVDDDPDPPGWYEALYRGYPSYADRILRVRDHTGAGR